MKKIKQYRLKGIYYRSFMVLIVIPILIVFIAAIFIIRQMMEDSAIRNIERVQKNMCMNLENEIQDFLETYLNSGLKVRVWTVNKKEDMKMFMDAGVDAVITNYPDLALK